VSDTSRAASPRIVVVRHGATEWTELGRHTGKADIPLSDAGRRQAARLADVLAAEQLDRVFCSPLRRALETCELAGLGARAEIVDDLPQPLAGDAATAALAAWNQARTCTNVAATPGAPVATVQTESSPASPTAVQTLSVDSG